MRINGPYGNITEDKKMSSSTKTKKNQNYNESMKY